MIVCLEEVILCLGAKDVIADTGHAPDVTHKVVQEVSGCLIESCRRGEVVRFGVGKRRSSQWEEISETLVSSRLMLSSFGMALGQMTEAGRRIWGGVIGCHGMGGCPSAQTGRPIVAAPTPGPRLTALGTRERRRRRRCRCRRGPQRPHCILWTLAPSGHMCLTRATADRFVTCQHDRLVCWMIPTLRK